MGGKQQVSFALAALVAGLAWGYISHRHDRRAPLFALLQGLEWFVAYGGAAALIEAARRLLDPEAEDADEEASRVSHFRQVVEERTGTDG